MKKEIKFSAKLETEQFNRDIEMMQRKLKEMYAPSDMVRMQSQTADRLAGAGIGGLSRPTQEAYARATQQSRREMDQSLQKEAQTQEKMAKLIERRNQLLKDLQKQQQDMVKGSEEELRIKEKIARVEENNQRLRDNYRARDRAINDTMDARERLMGDRNRPPKPEGLERLATAYKHGGISGAATAGGRMIKQMGPAGWIGLGAAGVTALAGAAQIGGNIYAGYQNAGINTASGYGNAMQGVLGRDASAAYNGRSAFEMAFLPEKQRALELARQGMKGDRVNNVIGATASPVMTTAEYAAKGAAWGAGAGAIVGGVAGGVGGAGVGAIPGAIAGGKTGAWIGGAAGTAYGAFKGMGNSMGNAKDRALMLSPLSDKFNNEYEAMMAEDFSEKYNKALEGLKSQNPFKTLAAEQYQNTYMRNLDFQRSTGLNYDTFHGEGGFRDRAIAAGFTDEMAMGASGNILSAGGSTRMAQDSTVALQAARGYNLTNAGQTLGTLSSSLGSSEQSKQAFVKMLAEGTRLGLDDSAYAEENRKFMDATAQVIARSGSTSQTDIERLMGTFGGFLNEKTTKGIEAAGSAYQMYNEKQSQTGGPRGVMRAAAFLRDEKLGKMSAMDRAALSNISQDQLSTDDESIQYLANKYNMSPDELVERTLGANNKSLNYTARADKAMERAKTIQKQLSQLGSSPEDMKKREELEKQLKEARGEYSVAALYENPELGKNRKERESFVSGATSVDFAQSIKDRQSVQDRLEGKKTDKIEDESVAGAAEGSRVVLENFRKFKDDLVPAAEAIKQFNDKIAQLVETAKSMPEGQRAKFFETIGNMYGTSQTQPQGGKSGK